MLTLLLILGYYTRTYSFIGFGGRLIDFVLLLVMALISVITAKFVEEAFDTRICNHWFLVLALVIFAFYSFFAVFGYFIAEASYLGDLL